MSVRRTAAAIALLSGLVMGCSSGPVSEASFFAGAATSSPSGSTAGEPDGGEPSTSAPAASAPAASASAAPSGSSPGAHADAPPPKPGSPTFTLVGTAADPGGGGTTVSYQLTWTAPDGVATAFRVYGLKVCLRDSAAFDGKPCIVRHMQVPARQLVLLGEAPGDARSITVSWQVPDGATGTGPYPSILMRATNDAGDSIFTIVHTEKVCYRCGS
jgi:hypothetical protein